jgi:endonuclease/exonuclease/phosphatase family metal-dependent hydrolase
VVAVAHLSLGAASRRAQLAFIAELLVGHPHVALMGDFNCVPDGPEMDLLYSRTYLRRRRSACPLPQLARSARSTTSC